MKISKLLIFCIPLFIFPTNLLYSQKKTDDINKDIDKVLKSKPKNEYTIPVKNVFNNKIEKVNNINQANNVKLENKEGGIVYLFSPQEQEKKYRDEFSKIVGKIFEEKFNAFEKNLNENIKEWNNNLHKFGELLKSDSIKLNKKKEGLNLIKKYKQIIDVTKQLKEDYKDEILVEEDKKGKKKFLFDLEKIKNNPSYIFVEEEIGGFRIAKKFNKYGYLSSVNSENNSKFKYTNCIPYENGYGIAKDKNYIYIIDFKGEEILSFKNGKVKSIKVLPNDKFIIRATNRYKTFNYFIDAQGNKLTDD